MPSFHEDHTEALEGVAKSALRAEPALAVRQRLGYVLEVLGRQRLAATVRASLPGRLTPVRLKQRRSLSDAAAPTARLILPTIRLSTINWTKFRPMSEGLDIFNH